MVSGGVRLALLIAGPLLGALFAHELSRRRRAAMAAAISAVAVTAALAISVIGSTGGGASLERTFGTAVPGVDLTVRGDATSISITLIAALATAISVVRVRGDPGRLTGALLALGGTVIVAVAGTLVQVGAGVEVIATGALLLGAPRRVRAPGLRGTVLLVGLLAAAGLALVAAAVQLLAAAGSSDLAFVSSGAVAGAVALTWALAGALLLLAPTLAPAGSTATAEWPAIAAAPAGFLVLLRLQQTAGGQLPVAATVALGTIGALVALAGARMALRSASVDTAGRAAIAVVTGLLISAFAGQLARDGAVLAGLFAGVELAWLAAPAWAPRPTAWSTASAALVALPGGVTAAAALVALGQFAARGAGGFPQLTILSLSLAAAAVGVARRLLSWPGGWRPLHAGAVVAVLAGMAGGVVPGLALRYLAPALVGGAQGIQVDAGALQSVGAGWPGGYITVAVVLLVVGGSAALVLAVDRPLGTGVTAITALPMPRLGVLLTLRRRLRRPHVRLVNAVRSVDHWLEVQPQVAAVLIGAALAVLVFR